MSRIVVLFEVKMNDSSQEKYLELAAMLKELLKDFEGFVDAKRYISLAEDGRILSMNVWENGEALDRWRNVVKHRMCQKEGREKLFDSYKITVASIIREYTDKDRQQAPDDSNEWLM